MSPKEIRKLCRDIEDNFHPKGKLLSADEVCEIFHISKSTLYKKTSRHLIPMHKMPEGHRLLFYENELHEWIQSRGRRTEAGGLRSEVRCRRAAEDGSRKGK